MSKYPELLEFSCLNHLSKLFMMLINVKMPTIVIIYEQDEYLAKRGLINDVGMRSLVSEGTRVRNSNLPSGTFLIYIRMKLSNISSYRI